MISNRNWGREGWNYVCMNVDSQVKRGRTLGLLDALVVRTMDPPYPELLGIVGNDPSWNHCLTLDVLSLGQDNILIPSREGSPAAKREWGHFITTHPASSAGWVFVPDSLFLGPSIRGWGWLFVKLLRNICSGFFRTFTPRLGVANI